jgi:catechol 2,3-dioxygenase-like lactoylglutathione lyase family enzyme
LPLLNDIHHLTFITSDLDRLIALYERVFGARVTVDLEEGGLRHAFIEVGPHTVLHPFEVPGVEPPSSQPMFQRGRLDHFALNAASFGQHEVVWVKPGIPVEAGLRRAEWSRFEML